MLRVANSTPIVDLESRLNSLRVNRERRLDLPTPESPIRTTLHSLACAYMEAGESPALILTFEEKLQTSVSMFGFNKRRSRFLTSYSSFAMAISGGGQESFNFDRAT